MTFTEFTNPDNQQLSSDPNIFIRHLETPDTRDITRLLITYPSQHLHRYMTYSITCSITCLLPSVYTEYVYIMYYYN